MQQRFAAIILRALTAVSRTAKYWILGRPVCLSHAKYTRNALLFNLGVVLALDDTRDSHVTALQQLFRPHSARETLLLDSLEEVLTKLGNYLATLEIEKEFLSRGRENKTKPGYQSPHQARAELMTFDQFPHVMRQLLTELNTRAECAVSLTDSHLMHVKLLAKWPDPPEVLDYQVPVPITDLSQLVTGEWDLSVQRIIPLVDGVHYTKKIALLADMDIELVKRAVQHLVYYDCARLVHDVMQSSNRYTAMAQLTRLMHHRGLQSACLKAVRLTAQRSTAPPLTAIMRLYAALRPHQPLVATLRELEGHAWLAHFDLRGFITFGLVHGLIRRVHKYPLSLDVNYWNRFRTESGELWDTSDSEAAHEGLRFNPSAVLPQVQQMTDGKHSYDEISCALGLPYLVIDQFFDKSIYR